MTPGALRRLVDGLAEYRDEHSGHRRDAIEGVRRMVEGTELVERCAIIEEAEPDLAAYDEAGR